MLDRRVDISRAARLNRREQFLATVRAQAVVRIERQNVGRVCGVEAGITAKPEAVVCLVLQYDNAIEAGGVRAPILPRPLRSRRSNGHQR